MHKFENIKWSTFLLLIAASLLLTFLFLVSFVNILYWTNYGQIHVIILFLLKCKFPRGPPEILAASFSTTTAHSEQFNFHSFQIFGNNWMMFHCRSPEDMCTRTHMLVSPALDPCLTDTWVSSPPIYRTQLFPRNVRIFSPESSLVLPSSLVPLIFYFSQCISIYLTCEWADFKNMWFYLKARMHKIDFYLWFLPPVPLLVCSRSKGVLQQFSFCLSLSTSSYSNQHHTTTQPYFIIRVSVKKPGQIKTKFLMTQW